MINQRHCPFCKAAASEGCSHLALAAEGRDFVRRCVELSHGQSAWGTLCHQSAPGMGADGGSMAIHADFTWLETAFCERFLRNLRWFGGLDHEWRTGPVAEQGGFWVLLWSKEPQKLWWELRGEFERQTVRRFPPPDASLGLVWLQPK
jgi:hypothetical protein